MTLRSKRRVVKKAMDRLRRWSDKPLSRKFLRMAYSLALVSGLALPGISLAQTPTPTITPTPTAFTVVIIPDTQNYVIDGNNYYDIFDMTTEWIADNKSALNITMCLGLGDIVEHYNDSIEWSYASSSMKALDGVVDYMVVPGNHDINVNVDPKTSVDYDTWFGPSRFDSYPYYSGNYPSGSNRNNYTLFEAGGQKFIAIGIEFCPDAEDMEWADLILAEYPDRYAIVYTHLYMFLNNQRSVGETGINCHDYACGGTEADVMFTDLVKKHNNIFLVESGHVSYEAMPTPISRITDSVNNRPVHQLLHDWQDVGDGGDGWVAYLTVSPSENKIEHYAYSPYLEELPAYPDIQFTLDLPPPPAVSWLEYNKNKKNQGFTNRTGPDEDVTLEWSYDVGGDPYRLRMSTDGKIYYLSSADLYAINSDGTMFGSYDPGIWSGGGWALSENGTAYLSTADAGVVFAVNSDMTMEWSYVGLPNWYSGDTGPGGITTVMADGDIVVNGSSSEEGPGWLACISSVGGLNWSYNPIPGDTFCTITKLVVSDTDRICGQAGGDGTPQIFYSYNSDGSLYWSYDATGFPSITSYPVINKYDQIVYPLYGGESFAVFESDGTFLWSYSVADDDNPHRVTYDYGNELYVGVQDATGQRLASYNSNGTLNWSYASGLPHGSSAIDYNGSIYYGSTDNRLYSLTSAGLFRWSYLTDNDVSRWSPPCDRWGA